MSFKLKPKWRQRIKGTNRIEQRISKALDLRLKAQQCYVIPLFIEDQWTKRINGTNRIQGRIPKPWTTDRDPNVVSPLSIEDHWANSGSHPSENSERLFKDLWMSLALHYRPCKVCDVFFSPVNRLLLMFQSMLQTCRSGCHCRTSWVVCWEASEGPFASGFTTLLSPSPGSASFRLPLVSSP